MIGTTSFAAFLRWEKRCKVQSQPITKTESFSDRLEAVITSKWKHQYNWWKLNAFLGRYEQLPICIQCWNHFIIACICTSKLEIERKSFFLAEANKCLIVIPLLILEKLTSLKKFDMSVCHKVKITQCITILYIRWKFVMSFDQIKF